MDAIAFIKQRIEIAAWIGRHVALVRRGGSWRGTCPLCGGEGVLEVLPDSQTWRCRGACGTGGDVIGFAARLFSEDRPAALARLTAEAERGEPQGWVEEDSSCSLSRRAGASAPLARRVCGAGAVAPDTPRREAILMRRARLAWEQAQPIAGTPAEAFLRGQGVRGPLPRTLRAARLPFVIPAAEEDGPERNLGVFDAVAAAVTDEGHRLLALHLTFLESRGGRWRRARVPDPDRPGACLAPESLLAPARGGAVHLSAATPVLLLGAGIVATQMALQRARAAPPSWAAGARVSAWAAVSLARIAGPGRGLGAPHPDGDLGVRLPAVAPELGRGGIALPDVVATLVLLREPGGDPFVADALLERAARRYRNPARRVLIADAGEDLDVLGETA